MYYSKLLVIGVLSLEIFYEQHENYLQIRVKGYNRIEEFFDSLEKALDICKKRKYSNLVLDLFIVDFSKIQEMDIFYVGEKIAYLFNNPNLVKIAVLAPKENQDKLAENVAANRGAILKAFSDKNDALEWINK